MSYNRNNVLSVFILPLLFVKEIDMRFYSKRNAIAASVFSHLLIKSLPTHFIEESAMSFYCLLCLCYDS